MEMGLSLGLKLGFKLGLGQKQGLRLGLNLNMGLGLKVIVICNTGSTIKFKLQLNCETINLRTHKIFGRH